MKIPMKKDYLARKDGALNKDDDEAGLGTRDADD